MDKLAQKRRLNFLNRIKEDTNLSGKFLEYKNKDFENFMDKLREVDETVRELVVSESGDNSLKDHIKVARSNFNRREYVNTVIILGRFHEILAKIAAEFKSLEIDQGKIHNKFLFDNLDESQKKFLMEVMPETFKKKETKKAKASIVTDAFLKEAGIGDMWHNLTSERGQALKAWEKRFPKFAKAFKRETEKMLNRSDGLFNTLTATLKSLGILRAHRKAEEYLATAVLFIKKFDGFHNEFGAYYDQYVNQLVQTQKSIDSELPKATPGADVASEPAAVAPASESPPVSAPETAPISGIVPAAAPSAAAPPSAPAVKQAPPVVGKGTVMPFPPKANPSQAPSDAQAARMKHLADLVEKDTIARKEKEKEKPTGNGEVTKLEGIDASSASTPTTKSAHEKKKQVIHEYIPDTLRDGDFAFEEEAPDTIEETPDTIEETPDTVEDVFLPAPPKLPFEFEELVNEDQKNYERKLQLMEQRERQKEEQERPTFAPPKNAEQFLAELNSFAGENSLVVAAKIVKFANSIAKSDKATSDKLLLIAKNLLSKI
jgi:hypothetical protein